MTYRQALAYLDSLGRFGIRLGLERMHALLEALGRPERRVPHVIHVGGTNGKGSVSAMAAAILEAAGFRTGLYTSPHLEDLTERYRIAGRPVARSRLARAIAAVRPHAEALARAGDPATAFEVMTAAGYLLFAQEGVEWLVQEVGLGGRLDSTNVLERPDATVITPLGLDHTDRLGSTLRAIAREKAGILRPGCPLVTAAEGEALEVVRERARRLGAPVVRVVPAEDRRARPARGEALVRVRLRGTGLWGTCFDLEGDLGSWPELEIPLPGPHQALNGGLAAAAVLVAARVAGIRVEEAAVRQGLRSVRWPGRLEVARRRPLVLLDGAHNAEGMEALLRALALLVPRRPLYLVFGLLRDKERAFTALARLPANVRVEAAWTVAPPAGGRELPAGESARRLQALGIPARPAPGPEEALAAALAAASCRGGRAAVVVCGSLYLVGSARALLRRQGAVRRLLRAGERAITPAG